MPGTLTVSITGHATVSGSLVNFTLSFTVAVADSTTAQTVLNGIKTLLTTGGATIDNSSGTFTPQSTGLT